MSTPMETSTVMVKEMKAMPLHSYGDFVLETGDFLLETSTIMVIWIKIRPLYSNVD